MGRLEVVLELARLMEVPSTEVGGDVVDPDLPARLSRKPTCLERELQRARARSTGATRLSGTAIVALTLSRFR